MNSADFRACSSKLIHYRALNRETAGVDVVEAQEVVGEVAHCVADVDPLLPLVEVEVAQAVGLDDVDLLVQPIYLALARFEICIFMDNGQSLLNASC